MKAVHVQAWELESSHEYDTAVVIDVLRFTTTATVLLARGGLRVYVVSEPEALPVLERIESGPLLVFSELKSVPSSYRRVDNSPAKASTVVLDATPVLVTTNGTIATRLASSRARTVVLASFNNLTAAADYVRVGGARSVAAVSAGSLKKRTPRTEDDVCAAALLERLRGNAPDRAECARRCREDAHVHERLLHEKDLEDDVAIALSFDTTKVVPIVEPTRDPRVFALRVG